MASRESIDNDLIQGQTILSENLELLQKNLP